jgi:signal recognition particle GTPase
MTDVRFNAEYGLQSLLLKRRHWTSRVKRLASAVNPRANMTTKQKAAVLVNETLKLLEEGRKSITYHEKNKEYVMIVGKAGTGEIQNQVYA